MNTRGGYAIPALTSCIGKDIGGQPELANTAPPVLALTCVCVVCATPSVPSSALLPSPFCCRRHPCGATWAVAIHVWTYGPALHWIRTSRCFRTTIPSTEGDPQGERGSAFLTGNCTDSTRFVRFHGATVRCATSEFAWIVLASFGGRRSADRRDCAGTSHIALAAAAAAAAGSAPAATAASLPNGRLHRHGAAGSVLLGHGCEAWQGVKDYYPRGCAAARLSGEIRILTSLAVCALPASLPIISSLLRS